MGTETREIFDNRSVRHVFDFKNMHTDFVPFRRSCYWLVVFALLLTCSCGEEKQGNPHVGNMSDFSYGGQRTAEVVVYRVNAMGETVSVVEFEGHFIWADYAAPWCKPCVAQAQVIRRLEKAYRDEVVFLTVMTSASPEFQSTPTQQTARAWSQRFGLNPDRVLAANNLWGMTIPTHILYSPEGQTLFRFTGYMSAEQIRSILSKYAKDWKNWSENAVIADWMRFSE